MKDGTRRSSACSSEASPSVARGEISPRPRSYVEKPKGATLAAGSNAFLKRGLISLRSPRA